MSSKAKYPEVAGILAAFQNEIGGGLGKPFALSDVPAKMREFERKYLLGGTFTSAFFTMFPKLIASGMVIVDDPKDDHVKPFGGIDEYTMIVREDGSDANLRFRFGSNRPPQITCKGQIIKGDNTDRTEFNLDVKYRQIQDGRAQLALMASFAKVSHHFCLVQYGNFCIVKIGRLRTEFVLYKVQLYGSSDPPMVFAEIEPKDFEKPEEALEAIENLEGLLGIKDKVCNESLGEIFRKKVAGKDNVEPLRTKVA